MTLSSHDLKARLENYDKLPTSVSKFFESPGITKVRNFINELVDSQEPLTAFETWQFVNVVLANPDSWNSILSGLYLPMDIFQLLASQNLLTPFNCQRILHLDQKSLISTSDTFYLILHVLSKNKALDQNRLDEFFKVKDNKVSLIPVLDLFVSIIYALEPEKTEQFIKDHLDLLKSDKLSVSNLQIIVFELRKSYSFSIEVFNKILEQEKPVDYAFLYLALSDFSQALFYRNRKRHYDMLSYPEKGHLQVVTIDNINTALENYEEADYQDRSKRKINKERILNSKDPMQTLVALDWVASLRLPEDENYSRNTLAQHTQPFLVAKTLVLLNKAQLLTPEIVDQVFKHKNLPSLLSGLENVGGQSQPFGSSALKLSAEMLSELLACDNPEATGKGYGSLSEKLRSQASIRTLVREHKQPLFMAQALDDLNGNKLDYSIYLSDLKSQQDPYTLTRGIVELNRKNLLEYYPLLLKINNRLATKNEESGEEYFYASFFVNLLEALKQDISTNKEKLLSLENQTINDLDTVLSNAKKQGVKFSQEVFDGVLALKPVEVGSFLSAIWKLDAEEIKVNQDLYLSLLKHPKQGKFISKKLPKESFSEGVFTRLLNLAKGIDFTVFKKVFKDNESYLLEHQKLPDGYQIPTLVPTSEPQVLPQENEVKAETQEPLHLVNQSAAVSATFNKSREIAESFRSRGASFFSFGMKAKAQAIESCLNELAKISQEKVFTSPDQLLDHTQSPMTTRRFHE